MENIEKKIEVIYNFFKNNNINKYANYSRKKLLNIKKLDLSSSKLNYIPKEINILTNLEILDICNNKIEEIPDSICSLVNLKYIDASFNKLRKLPKKIASLKNIEEIDIANNMFKTFPKEIYDLKQLKCIYISGYSLNEIPNEIFNLVKLENRIHDKVSKYSLGMRQRLGIAQAILHEPNLLILDEPTNGLDPEGIKEMRELLVDLAVKEKMAILISSHNLAELDNFCTKVCIIKNGEVIETSEISEIKKETSQDLQLFEVDDVNLVKNIIKDITIMDNHRFKINVPKENVPEMIEKLVENKIKIYEVKQEEKTLEDAFFEKTGGNVIE